MICKIGDKIRSLRLQHKMTQEQLAARLGVSYQSISRWENGVTYPDIEFLPAIAKHFSVSLDYLLGQDDAEKQKQIKKRIRSVDMTEDNAEDLIELIRMCRREQDNGEYFESICYRLLYSPLHRNTAVLDELRKSKEIFFETCTDATIRSRALKYYASLEEESHIRALLDRYASDQTTAKDYLLKERYLFRDEFDHFNTARQRYFHKQIAYLIDGDMELWHDTSKPITVQQALFICNTKLALIHNLCQETPTNEHPITCGNAPDIFAEQRVYIGIRLACAYANIGEKEKAYAAIEDVITLTEQLMTLPEGTELFCTSPSLSTLGVTVKYQEKSGNMGHGKSLFYTLENGEVEMFDLIIPEWEFECLAKDDFGIWSWLNPIRKEERFVKLMQRLEKMI